MHKQPFLPPEATSKASRLVWTQGNHLLIEGCGKLIACDENCIRLKVQEGLLSVRGDTLSIGCLAPDYLTVCGCILALERET